MMYRKNNKIKFIGESSLHLTKNKNYTIYTSDSERIISIIDNTGYPRYMTTSFIKENFIEINYLKNKIAKIRKLIN